MLDKDSQWPTTGRGIELSLQTGGMTTDDAAKHTRELCEQLEGIGVRVSSAIDGNTNTIFFDATDEARKAVENSSASWWDKETHMAVLTGRYNKNRTLQSEGWRTRARRCFSDLAEKIRGSA